MNEAALLREPADATLEDARLASALVAPEAIDADDGESTPPAPLPLRPTGIDRGGLLDRVRRTCSRIAPLWPLKHFVAVNPFLGYADRDFESTVARLERVAGARALMPREWFRRHVDSGRITRADVVDALAQRAVATGERDVLAGLDADAILRRASAADAGSARRAPVRGALTYADAVDRAHGTQWARLATEEISKWCAAYFDEGQSAWRMPWRSLPLYSAWRAAAMRDRTPEVLGLAGFRAAVERLPDEPLATIAIALERLGLSAERSTDYLDRALASVAGWTAHARYREWQEQLHGAVDESPIRMLAIRLAWDAVLAELCGDEASRTAWRAACTALGVPDALDAESATDAVLQGALEIAHARDLSARLAAHAAQATTVPRPEAQAVFCIDVRSEVYRRALETVAPTVATHGFAGFFGFALEYVRVGQPQGTDHCPALLKPAFVVRETVRDAAPAEERAVLALRAVRRRAAKAWKSFRTSAVSCFGYVESAGLAFGPKLLRDALGIARPAAATEGLDAHAIARLAP